MPRSLFLMIGLAAMLALPARADDAPSPAEKPMPKVGDVFEYAKRFVTVRCTRWEVKAVGQDGYNVLQCGDNLAYIDAATNELARIVSGNKHLVEFKPLSPTLSFPLQVGKKWDGTYDGYREDTGVRWNSTVSCEVKSFEPVKVAAGEFQAYRIACTDNWQSSPFSGSSASTTWYAPKVGIIVKAVNPSQSDFDYELVSYQVR